MVVSSSWPRTHVFHACNESSNLSATTNYFVFKKHFINFAIILTMNGNASIGLFGILGIIFIVLKLVDVIDWSWWWVLAPFWIEAIIFMLFIIIWILFESRG